ncbi:MULTISPECIES: hypothetical protein [Erwinia]|uniref:hypothetical protein n=1 Tax=Erwinia TaxID=551 RepID=UPI000550355C|nr:MULTISPECIES: hypothetical protein [Erwinia]
MGYDSVGTSLGGASSSLQSNKTQLEQSQSGSDYASDMAGIMKQTQQDNLQKAEMDRQLAKSNGQANSATTAASAANQNKITY